MHSNKLKTCNTSCKTKKNAHFYFFHKIAKLILQIYTNISLCPEKKAHKNGKWLYKVLQYIVLVGLFMARICFTIGSPYTLWPFSSDPLFLHIRPNMYDTGLISIKKPQNATLKGFSLPVHSVPLLKGSCIVFNLFLQYLCLLCL